jgi:hypothetical protein
MSDNRIRDLAERLTKQLADNGKLLEAGWQSYRLLCLKLPPHVASDGLREAFMAGAEHTFASIINMLDPGSEETEADLKRMDLLHAELEPVRRTMTLKYGRTAGRA